MVQGFPYSYNFKKVTKSSFLISLMLSVILLFPHGNIWIGGHIGPFAGYSHKADRFKTYSPDRNNPYSTKSFSTFPLLADRNTKNGLSGKYVTVFAEDDFVSFLPEEIRDIICIPPTVLIDFKLNQRHVPDSDSTLLHQCISCTRDMKPGNYTFGLVFIMALFGRIRIRTRSLQKNKEKLNIQVKERTREIEKQKKEIQATKEELQTTLDNLKKIQVQLIKSEKLASLGSLVAGMAHEINTPVGISVTAASTLAEETKQMAELYKAEKVSRAKFIDFLNTANQSTRLILANMERTADMVQSFKQVSTDRSTEEKRTFKLKAYIEDIFRSLYPKLKDKKFKINLSIDEKLEINSYPGAFSQIITNLVLNSATHGFAGREKGFVEIKASEKETQLVLEYRDNGKGISKDTLSRVFEPFFTTSKSTGTGLGMHIVYNLVTQKLQGSIQCDSEEGKGVLFTLKIPISA